jgi:ABC-type branched-subunit amino acid transport system ATPase component
MSATAKWMLCEASACELAAKSIVTIVGANGAGKSTCLNAIAGLLPSRGATRLDGMLIDEMEIEERLAQGASRIIFRLFRRCQSPTGRFLLSPEPA